MPSDNFSIGKMKRRDCLRSFIISALAGNLGMRPVFSKNKKQKENILFIAIDDMNDWVGFLNGHPQVKTPNMDRLAKRSIIFANAHCTAPICGPSRGAIMSGKRPETTGVYTNDANYKKHLSHEVSMPLHFKMNGYKVLGAGKLFHGSYPKGTFNEYGKTHKGPFPSGALENAKQNPSHTVEIEGKKFTLPMNGMPADRHWNKRHTFDWGSVDLPDTYFKDFNMSRWIIEQLQKKHDKPFWIGAGFHLPHQPLYAPKRFCDMYPVEKIKLPPHIEDDINDLSQAGIDYALRPTTSGLHKTVVKYGQWKNAVSCYLGTISFVDFMVGNILDALENSPYKDNTHIILWSDNGWHLGEKNHWGKATPWNRASRVPFLISPARISKQFMKRNLKCNRPVNLIDLFPTLTDLAGIPGKPGVEGQSLVPLLQDPKMRWNEYTAITIARGNHAVQGEQ